jgi:2,4-dienoyl-CoA reductase-like NADH-dependent reductase (Old Yellow Enzyme family)
MRPLKRETMTDPLFQPLTIRHITFKNRFMSTSHACGLEEGGMPKERYQRYHEEKAKGGIGLTMFGGSSNVAPDSPSVFQQLYVGDDEVIPYLIQFSERVHQHGTAIMCQITHLGRRGEPYAGHWLPTIGPSAIRETLHRSFPKEMDDNDIDRVVKAYGQAARRCKEGGLDGIETLGNAHLIGQFLSPATNKRTDDYGGSLENRCRFGLMVFEEIRHQAGDDFLIGFRCAIDEAMQEGLSQDECIEIAHVFERSGYIDFFNGNYGRMDTLLGLAVDNMPGMASPIAPWLQSVGAFKREVTLPVFHAARITDIATARHAIQEDLLDMVAMTRAHIADPHLVNKLANGREDEIRPCVGATHCMSPQRPVCLHNPATGRENKMPQVVQSSDRPQRKAVVVGGGPAGLEAARVLGERGHHVVLFEAAPRLGGQVLIGVQASWRIDLAGVVDWRANEAKRLGVDVRTSQYAGLEDVLAEFPDIVIVATGGVPDLDWLEGVEHCTSAWDFLTGNATVGEEVLVYDGTGRHPALQCSEHAATSGAKTALVSIDGEMAAELTYAERAIWKQKIYEADVIMTFDHRLIRIAKDGNRLTATFINEATGQVAERTVDQVVVEHGTIPADGLYQALRGNSGNNGVTDLDTLLSNARQPKGDGFELHRIGDAVASRNIAAAVYDALRLCHVM